MGQCNIVGLFSAPWTLWHLVDIKKYIVPGSYLGERDISMVWALYVVRVDFLLVIWLDHKLRVF